MNNGAQTPTPREQKRMNAILRRGLIYLVLLLVVAATSAAAGLSAAGLEEVVRWYNGLSLVVGGGLATYTLLRYIEPGPTVPALLALTILTKMCAVLIGVSICVDAFSAITDPGALTREVTGLNVASFAARAAGATGFLCLGIYIFAGRGRGWIYADVNKAFWRDPGEPG